MVLMRYRRTEQGKDTVAGGLDDVAAVTMHCVDHQLERRVNN